MADPPATVYADTSALVKLVVAEVETNALSHVVIDAPAGVEIVARARRRLALRRLLLPGSELWVPRLLSRLEQIGIHAGSGSVSKSAGP